MQRKFEDLLFNPFARRVIERPRKLDVTIEGLNETTLRDLQREFGELLQGSVPRRGLRKQEIQFVISADPGYGKSHLIGRLFSKLERTATRVYVTPFTDPSNVWISLLSRFVQEMSLPESGEADVSEAGEASQMDAFAQAVLSRAFLGLSEANPGLAPRDRSVLTRLQGIPLVGFDLGDPDTPESRWVGSLTESELNEAACLLPSLGVQLQPGTSAESWLRVLFLYSSDRLNIARRNLALEWVEARLHQSEVADLGLSPQAGLDDEVDRAGRNEAARGRVMDFCALSGLFRPVLICFDQTETFGQRPELASSFGNLVADLFQQAPHQMTIVTANEDKWNRDIRPHIDDAHLERFGIPRYLEEISPSQSQELARRRLASCDLAESEIERFVDSAWLEEVVPPGGVSVRRFLEEAARRFGELSQRTENQASLPDLLQSEKLELTSETRRLRTYQADLYQWAVLEVPQVAQPGFRSSSFQSRRDYFTARWDLPEGKTILFGFEDRDNHRTWEAIAKEAKRQAEASTDTSVVMLRLEHQNLIPGSRWGVAPFIREVIQAGHLRIVALSEERCLTLHSSWELYSAACQGNIDASPAEVLRLAAQQFSPWWAELMQVEEVAEPLTMLSPEEMIDAPALLAIEEIIRERRFVGEDDLLKELSARNGRSVAPATLRITCERELPQVRSTDGSGTVAYSWVES